MAILWSKQEGDTRYEVRSAGNTRRLYTNGVFHSQYNANQPVTGSVWDLLLIPAFFLPAGTVRRVLVLGVGGGAVIRQLNHFLQPEQIVGVELNPVHLEVAREYFGVEAANVELHQADARWWVKQYRGEPFDLIIDDIFTDADGDPQRAVAADGPWMRGLIKHLNRDGVLVCNFGSGSELRQSGYFTNTTITNRFARAFQLTTPLYENAIGAFLSRPAEAALLRQRLRAISGLNTDQKGCRLNYRIKRL
ncbi:MAG: methyltransferase domain-containing protein [Chromatiales bacterium]|nr:methyltransferase domain-containing protein [Chromatiales bacterium]